MMEELFPKAPDVVAAFAMVATLNVPSEMVVLPV
jgi:hypothetical protein